MNDFKINREDEERTLYYLDIVINYLNRHHNVKTEMYLDSQDLENYEQIKTIVVNAFNGIEDNGLYRMNDVRRFLQSIGEYYKGYDIAQYIYKLLILLRDEVFEKPITFVTRDEAKSIKQVGEKYRLPYEMRDEISSFIGFNPYQKGGRKRKTNYRKNKKTKKSNKKRRTLRRMK